MSLTPQLDLSRPSSNADTWGRYYTVDWISQSLVNAVPAAKPKIIVELGAGQGSLATAAAARWHAAQVITVDVDSAALTRLHKPGRHRTFHKHHVQDALDDALAEKIGLSLESVDVAVCNPPYVRPRWRAGFGRILEDAGLSGALQSVHDAGADLLFIAQNLRLLKTHGKLGLILPDGLITAEKFQGVRSVLLREHLIESVVQLPRRVFSRTEAQTYLVVLSKRGGQTQSVELREMRATGELSQTVHVPADLARRRLDYSFHSSAQFRTSNPLTKTASGKHFSIRDATLAITRGSVVSNQIDSFDWPVFHLGDFASAVGIHDLPVVPKQYCLSSRQLKTLPATIRVANAGDILIARIGRNLHNKVCSVSYGACVISDCVFSLSVASKYRDTVLAYLTSGQGQSALAASSHGVGARYLSRADVLDLMVPF